MNKHWLISRRTVLRGLGVAMALPLLESMGWAENPTTGKGGATRSPVRTAFIMIPNGVVMDHWKFKAKATGALPRILVPIAPIISEVLVINGLRHDKAAANGDGAGDHAREAGTFLTGAQCRKTAGTDIQSGVSIDQAMAEKIGIHTSLPSLELGLEPGQQAGNCDSGYSCAYSSNISWRTPNSPMAKETNPKAAFDRMFSAKKNLKAKKSGAPSGDPGKFAVAQSEGKSLDQSILDLVFSDAKSLRGKVSGTDQRKLDEYLDSVRALEKRIEHAEKEAADAAKAAVAKKPGTYSPTIEVAIPSDLPSGFPERTKLMMDLMILAFQTDTTRIATFMIGNGGSNRTYPHIGVSRAHHEISHHQKDAEKLEDLTKINTHHIELFSYMLQKMKGLNDGKGTLLDNSMIMYGSAISDGDRHNHDDLPILLAGRGGGTINSGRMIDTKSNMCDLFLAIAARAGCQLEKHGDSTKMMEGLS
jgi:Protein of unknown function (DUF1552)